MKWNFNIVKEEAFWAIFDQAVSSGTSFLLTILLARKLSIAGFGFYSTVLLACFLLVSIFQALIIQPFQVLNPGIKDKKEYFSSLLIFQLVLLSLCLLGSSLIFFLPVSLPENCSLWSVLLFIAGYIINDFYRKLLLGSGKVMNVMLMDVLYLVLSVAGFAFSAHVQPAEVFILLGSFNLIASFPGYMESIFQFSFSGNWKFYLKKHLAHGKWLLGVALLQWGSSNFFVLVSGIYLGIEALGALRLVQSFFGVINVALQTVENYFLPKIAAIYLQNKTQAKNYLLQLFWKGGIVLGSAMLVLFLFADSLIAFAGGIQYASYGFLVKAIAVLYLFIFAAYPFRIAIRVLLLNRLFFAGYLISFVVSLCTFHLLFHLTGLYGAVLGLILNQLVMLLYWKNQLTFKYAEQWK